MGAIAALEAAEAENAANERNLEILTTAVGNADREIAALRACIAELEAQVPKWIPVTERLPEPDEWVLVSNGLWTGVGRYHPDEYEEPQTFWQSETSEFIELCGPKVLCWMPLPAAPTSQQGKSSLSGKEEA